MSKIEYTPGLRKIKAKIVPNLNVSRDAYKLMSDLFNDLNGKMVTAVKREFKDTKQTKGELLNHVHAHNAVRKMMKRHLRDFALTEGAKAVVRYENKLLKFNEQKALEPDPHVIPKVPRVIRPKPAGHYFSLKLDNILKLIHPDESLTINGRRLIGDLLYQTAMHLGLDAVRLAYDRTALNPEDILASARENLGPQMFAHADIEGSISLEQHYRGQLVFHPKKRRVVATKTDSKISSRRRAAFLSEKMKEWEGQHRAFFISGLKKLILQANLSSNMAYYNLEPRALKKINTYLLILLKNIASTTILDAIDSNRKELDPLQIKATVNKLFPPEIKRYAQVEGEHAVMMFNSGLLVFKPKENEATKLEGASPAVAKRRKVLAKAKSSVKSGRKSVEPAPQKTVASPQRKKKPILPDFSAPLNGLITEIHSTNMVGMSRNANDYLNGRLIDTVRRLTEVAISKVTGQELTLAEVQSAIRETFPGDLFKHASTEGDKAIYLHHSQDIQEQPPPQADQSQQPSAASRSSGSRSGFVTPEPEPAPEPAPEADPGTLEGQPEPDTGTGNTSPE